ncbi:Sapep family Mn(2+)-dependent dipeptidase [Candidatus Formimonas warabiya]|uniref:Peptidase M20 dimerisation domain-containing protein n=1 Tax=Formimonas warabiya TaxID=1761012 RepID=A0A3G1KVP3_FORW1|nr:Sapep family Mn(2+)-dependent dipeptidase [Candidatus Formimonas warabiya]ATW26558.1 hypothetical protein DCMF_18980 [Candidatus Formimonas warabiya]
MTDEYDRDVLFRFIDDHAAQMAADVGDLVRVPSVSKDLGQVAEALRLVLSKAAGMGLKAESLLDDRVGLVEIGQRQETVGVLAHVDVVDVDGDWTVPPYGGLLVDGEIWGRGAVDDKGPLVAALYALWAVNSLPLPKYKKVQLIIGTQEEVAWTDMEDYTGRYQTPDYGFTPDGEFPATNREKGYADIRLDFAKNEEGEKNFEILSLEAGSTVNAIPARAQALVRGEPARMEGFITHYLENYPGEKIILEKKENALLITAYGVAAHSSVPEKGKNAITLLCHFLNGLPGKKDGSSRLIAFIDRFFHGDIYGKAIGLYSQSEYLNGEYIHRNVISPTLLETKEGSFHVTFNLRTSFGTTREDIEKAFAAFAQQYHYTWTHLSYYEPIYVSKDMPFLKVLGEAYEEITGLCSEPALAHGTSYAKAMPNTVAWGPVFPGQEDFCHGADERISLASLVTAAKIYARALADLVFSPNSFK